MSLPLKSASAPPRRAASGPAQFGPIHPAELALAVILAVWACFLPWAFGTMHVWSQITSLGLAGAAFTLALWPRPDGGARRVRALVRSPVAWCALLLLVYVAVQGLNPAWVFRKSTTHWWMERREAIAWLPSGTDAPFSRMNQWRWMVIWGGTLLAAAAAWVGLTRRQTMLALLIVIALNATAVATLALAQLLSGTKKIFWTFDFPGAAGPFGSFVYKNHVAAFLLVGFGVACGLAWHFHNAGRAKGARSTPAPLFIFFACVMAAATIFSFSRLGTLLVMVSAAGFALYVMRCQTTSPRFRIALAVIAVGTGAVLWPLVRADASLAWQRLSALIRKSDSVQVRVYAYEATRRMIDDHRWFGVGAGGFRHLAPDYIKDFPFITQAPGFGPRGGMQVQRLTLQETHSDVLQLLAELGLVGGSLLSAFVSCSLAAISHSARRRHAIGFMAFITILLMLLFAWFDFPLHNPAVLGTLALFLALAARWPDTPEKPDAPPA